MAKQFTTQDTKSLIATHRNISQILISACNLENTYRGEIQRAADFITTVKMNEILQGISVDELAREKKGIRIKTLKDCGYNTMADIMRATPRSLADINGISDEGAALIKAAAAQIAAQAKSGVRIKLSTDDRSAAASQLVVAVSRYKNGMSHVKACQQVYGQSYGQIQNAIAALEECSGGLKWMFAGAQKKQNATAAYNYLAGLLNGPYAVQYAGVLQPAFKGLDDAAAITPDMAWADFAQNSVAFFNILEDICPGLLGTDDGQYGLPEELANEVADQTYTLDGLKCQLRRYQEWGVKYVLHQKRVLLGDEMGLGKTIQAIAAMVALRNTGATHFVVVCPASVITNWCREVAKMSDLVVVRVHGDSRQRALAQWIENGGVAVTTYETTGHFELPEGRKIDFMVVDEAHYIKNPQAQRTVNVKNLCARAERILFMTGTALENKVDEMIELVAILQPQVAQQIKSMASLSSAPQFREKIAGVYYRRKREDVLTELPELTEHLEWCDLMPEEKRVYEDSVMSKSFMAVRRVSWNVDDMKDSSKAQRLLELVEKAKGEGRKIIVFSFFLDTIAKIKDMLGDQCMPPINGSLSPQRRQEIIDDFEKAPEGSVLAAQIQSGGTGLNIQCASVVVLCEPQFKPSIENQAISRAYRMGQTRNVLVYRLLCDDTVDEKIMEILATKQDIFDAFADESAAADADESRQIDDKKFGNIIEEEIARIEAERGVKTNVEITGITENVKNSPEIIENADSVKVSMESTDNSIVSAESTKIPD